MKKLRRKAISVLLALLIMTTGIVPVLSAFAGDGVEGFYNLQIFYKDTDTIVPNETDEGEEYVEYMIEGRKLNLKYVLIDSVWPDNGYVKWYSDAPALVDVDQNGVVKAFDSSKGAVIHLWIDNEVKTIPLLGSALGSALEKVFFNEYVNLDSMDTDEIVTLLEQFFGSDSWIADRAEGYKGQLIDSLRSYLDKANTGIHCELYASDGTKLGEDVIKIVVRRNDEWYANFLPNGTHITNKSQIPTTQAKGGEQQLYGIVTPQRLGFGVVYSVKSSSIFSTGKVVATVNDSGLVSFKNKGEATIMCSPDSEEVIEAILKFVNYFYALENTGTLDTNKIAGILIDYVGIDMNRTVLAGILDVAFAVKDIAGDAADPVQLTATAVEILANIILQFTYNDTITFTVVDSQPIESFELDGVTTVKEGNEIRLEIANMVPSTGNKSDIVWESSDPSIASVDPETGVIKGLDAGGSLGSMSSQTCTITATSTTNNVSRSVTVTVTGRTGRYISHIDINGRDIVPIETSSKYTYSIYPKRVADSENLYLTWGIKTGEDEDGNPVYVWANADEPAVDANGVGKIDYHGEFTPMNGGTTTIALDAKTGYLLSDGTFYEISHEIATKEIQTGIPVESINVEVTGGTSNGKINRDNTVTINGQDYRYVTIHKGSMEAYFNNGAVMRATVYPSNATDRSVKWVCDNPNYKVEVSDETRQVEVKQKAGEERADTFNIYAVSNDGTVQSNVITVCVTKNYVNSNAIDQRDIEVINGKTADATHSMTFEDNSTGSYAACHNANWYSSDETVFKVRNKGRDNDFNAELTGVDVGTATLYCVSADGAFLDSVRVTVKPNKDRLKGIIDTCEKSIVLRTKDNKADYQTYLRKLDKANIVYYEEDMASQLVCDTVADDLLAAFIRVGGFIGIADVSVLGTNKEALKTDFVTVGVGTTSSYKNYSYDFDYVLKPANAMYAKIEWTSSNGSISVDKNGVCTPTANDPCSAVITCTVTDYNGGQVSDSKVVAFARTKATSVRLDKTEIRNAKIGESQKLTPIIDPTNAFGNSSASVQDCRWYTSNPDIATVDEEGVVTFVYGGSAVITCETMDGGRRATCNVYVVTNYDRLQLLVNQYNDLRLKEESFYPETWAPYIEQKAKADEMLSKHNSSQEEVDAQYAALKEAYDGLKKFVDIQRVELYLDGEATSEFYQYDLSLLREGISYKNAKLNLKVRLFPNNASYQSVKWETSTTDIAITNDGVASPTSEKKGCYGKITCTVTDAFGNDYSDDVWVSFSYVPVTAVNVSMDQISGTIGDTYQLTSVIEPQGSSLLHIAAATIKDYFWESDDESVATVDQTGLVTFTGAGSTIVRCVSYDGGVKGECKVSSQGDRTALKAAIEEYKDVDYTQYDYTYGTAFKTAYDNAQKALTNDSLNQDGIDAATNALISAAGRLEGHPYINVESINLTWSSQKRGLTGSTTQVASGTIGSNNAIGLDISSGYSNYNDYNDLTINAGVAPSNAMFQNVKWDIIQEVNLKSTTALGRITFTPERRSDGGWAKARVTYTNHYGATISRIVYVAMTDKPVTSLTVEENSLSLKGSASPYQLHWSVTDSSDIKDVIFTSSNEDVATVSADGKITPVEVGLCTITVQTVFGGIQRQVYVEITADFSVLASKVAQYKELLNNAQNTNEFTQASLDALAAEIANSEKIVNENKATQKEVNEALRKLEAARNNLEGYVAAEGIGIELSKESADTAVINPGFIRYSNTQTNGKTVQLLPQLKPAGSRYQTLTWTSDNDAVTVSADGLVTNSSIAGSVAKITCTITTIYGNTYADSVYVSFVRNPVTGISFTESLVYGSQDETKSVPVKFETGSTYIQASLRDAIYTSANEDVATVDDNGVVTFHNQGDTTITVVSLDGGYKGTIAVRTTWDTSALQEAIKQAKLIRVTDYEKAYSDVLTAKLEAAERVYANAYASQTEIDNACLELTTAITNLQGHEFVLPEVTLTVGDEELVNNKMYEVDPETKQIVVNCAVAGTMYKTLEITTADATGATASVNDNAITLTKTDTTGAVTIKVKVVDDYDRETNYSYVVKLTDTIVNIESISITYGEEVLGAMKTVSGFKYGYTDFTPFNLGYVSNTPNSTEPTSVSWSVADATYITIDANTGLVNLTTRGKIRTTNTANVTCTVTNADGSTVTQTLKLTIAQ